MKDLKKWLTWNYVVTACLAIVLVVSILVLHAYLNKFEELEQEYQVLSDSMADLYSQLRSLEFELDDLARTADSLLAELDYTILGPGTQPDTAAYRFTVVPKELAENTTLELTVGDTTVSFERDGEIFTGTVDIPLFEQEEDYPVLTVTTAGISKTDVLEEVDLWCTYRNWLPELFESMSGSEYSEHKDNTMYFAYGFRPITWYTDTPVTFTKITMTRTVNGKEVLNEDVTNRLRNDADQDFEEFYTEFEMDKKDRAVVLIRAWDSQGYIHELETRCQYEQESDCIESVTGTEQIYGPDGTALYTTSFGSVG